MSKSCPQKIFKDSFCLMRWETSKSKSCPKKILFSSQIQVGKPNELMPLCVLDFYVAERRQRSVYRHPILIIIYISIQYMLKQKLIYIFNVQVWLRQQTFSTHARRPKSRPKVSISSLFFVLKNRLDIIVTCPQAS